MNRSRMFVVAFALATVLAGAPTARAQFAPSPLAPQNESFMPRVPVSALAHPAAWFDPSRLHVSTSVSVGSGLGGGTEGLQVTSLSYQFTKSRPLWMNVSLGNAWGANAARSGSSMFLEGLDMGFQPFSSMQIQVHYRDLRSPLQYNNYSPYPYRWGE